MLGFWGHRKIVRILFFTFLGHVIMQSCVSSEELIDYSKIDDEKLRKMNSEISNWVVKNNFDEVERNKPYFSPSETLWACINGNIENDTICNDTVWINNTRMYFCDVDVYKRLNGYSDSSEIYRLEFGLSRKPQINQVLLYDKNNRVVNRWLYNNFEN